MSFGNRFLRIAVLFLVLLAARSPAQEAPRELAADKQTDVARQLDDAAAIARMLFERYRRSPAGTKEISGKLGGLENRTSQSRGDRREIERNAFQTFVWRDYDFYTKACAVSLRCAGRRGELVLVKFDRAGKIISCETDRDPSASHYAMDDYVTLFYIAEHLRKHEPRPTFDSLKEQELAFDDGATAKIGARPFALRNGKREGDFLITRSNGTAWCRGHFSADLPIGSWQLYAPDGKPTERWIFRDGNIERNSRARRAPFDYAGDLGAHDFAVTLVQGSPGPASGPPFTYLRVSAAGECEVEFGDWMATFRLTDEMQRAVRDLLRVIDIPSLKESYHDPHIEDGGWMKISLRTNGTAKTVRFFNWYPRPVRDLADFFAADVLPRYPMEFLGSVDVTDHRPRDTRTFLDDEE